MQRNIFVPLALFTGFLTLIVLPGTQASEIYGGKRIEILVHAPPGGSYDLHGRVLARHMGRHIPGNPTMILKNMPGGGGLIQANYLFRRAKPDGFTIGTITVGATQMEALGMRGIEYEMAGFEWLGLISDTVFMITSRRDAPIRTLEELLDPKREPLIYGTSGPPSSLYTVPAALNMAFERAIGRPLFKFVSGYGAVGPMRAALERGEIDGMSWTWDAIKGTAPHFLEPAPGKGFINLISYASVRPHPEMVELGVPFMPDRIKDPKDRAVVDFINSAPQTMWPVAAPPGTPRDRVRILREAFMKTMKDPEYRADIKRLNLSLNPMPAEELTKAIQSTINTPREIVELAKKFFEK